MDPLRLARGQALGNDYLVADAAALPWPLSAPRIRALCDRHNGVGGDGILLADTAARPFALRIFNPDGSEAEKSGNGLRIFAAWLHGRGLVGGEPFPVRLATDEVGLQVLGPLPAGALDIVADMGRASFLAPPPGQPAPAARTATGGGPRTPGAPAGSATPSGWVLAVGDERLTVHPLSLGNPHCVVFVEALRRDEFLRRGPALATHPAFAAGSNVQFARPLAHDRLEAWIWERGAGETLASGSSACAVAAAAVRLGLAREGEIDVVMPGGTARVRVAAGYELRLRGPAQILCQCTLTPGFSEGLAAL